MLSRAVPALLLLLLSAEHARADGLSWGSPSKKGCSRCNFRTYTAKLNNIPSGQKWENYCPGWHRIRRPECSLMVLVQLRPRWIFTWFRRKLAEPCSSLHSQRIHRCQGLLVPHRLDRNLWQRAPCCHTCYHMIYLTLLLTMQTQLTQQLSCSLKCLTTTAAATGMVTVAPTLSRTTDARPRGSTDTQLCCKYYLS